MSVARCFRMTFYYLADLFLKQLFCTYSIKMEKRVKGGGRVGVLHKQTSLMAFRVFTFSTNFTPHLFQVGKEEEKKNSRKHNLSLQNLNRKEWPAYYVI
jgi:hypothetical protein